MVKNLTGWEIISLLIFLLAAGFGDKRNPYNASLPIWLQKRMKFTHSQAMEKKQVRPFFGCCAADSQPDAGRYQMFNNGSLVLFFTACKHKMGVRTATSQGWGGPAVQYRQSRAEAE